MSSPPYMQFYVADYLADTGHLTTLEHGAYLLLLMAAWRSDGKLPSDDVTLARYCRMTKQQWLRVKQNVLGFFVLHEGVLTQPRLTAELQKYVVTLTARKECGALGGKSKALKTKTAGLAKATDLLQQNPSKPLPTRTRTIEEEVRTSSSVSKPSVSHPPAERKIDDFDQAWSLWPQKGRSAKSKALTAWRARASRVDSSEMLAAVRRYLATPDAKKQSGAFVPGFDRWVRDFLESWLEAGSAKHQFDAPVNWALRVESYRESGIWLESWGLAPTDDEVLDVEMARAGA